MAKKTAAYRSLTPRTMRIMGLMPTHQLFLASDHFSPDRVRTDLAATRRICDKQGCPLEFILKDISTVHYEPERLFEWARIAMQVAGAGSGTGV